jgi:hypothetical protein
MKYIALALLLLSGCAHRYHEISDQPDFWTTGVYDSNDQTLYYCLGNKKGESATPKCFAAQNYSVPDVQKPKPINPLSAP